MNNSDNANRTGFHQDYKNTSGIVLSCLSLIYSAPALFILVRLCMLFWKGRLQGSFQKLIVLCGVNDTLCYWLQMLTVRLPAWGILPIYGQITGVGLFTIPTLSCFALRNVVDFQICGCVLLSLNRASALVFPTKYERLWSSYGWLLVLSIVVSLQYLTYDIILIGAEFKELGPDAYLLETTKIADENWSFKTRILYATGAIICFALNIYTGVTLYYLKKRGNRTVNVKEIKFFYLCLVTLGCQVLLILTESLVYFAREDNITLSTIILNGRSIITDVNCLLPMYSLMLLSKQIYRMVFPKTRESSISTVISTI